MTRGYADQQGDNQQDQDPVVSAAMDQPSGLRPDLEAQLRTIQPGDDASLARLLQQHPHHRDQILAAAARYLGNATVQRALASGAPPSAANRADAMADFREVNGPQQPSAANRAGAMADFREVNGPQQPSAANRAGAMADFREVNGPQHPSAANSAAAMADFRDVNGPQQPSAAHRAAAMQDFQEVNAPVSPPRGLSGAPSVQGAPPSAANSAGAMEDFREVNSSAPAPAVGRPPSAANSAAAMDDFRAVNGLPSAANAAAAMQDFRDVNGPSATETPAPAPAPATEQHAKPESTWIVHARQYNRASPAASEFNSLTAGTCATADGADLDPNKVAQWQADHGVAPDGRVGPHTLAKARTVAAAQPAAPPLSQVASAAADPSPAPQAPQAAPPAVDPELLAELE